MAKKEKINLDKKMMEGIRRGCIEYMSIIIKTQLKKGSLDSICNNFQFIKDSYSYCKDEFVEDKLSYLDYCTFVDYVQDVYIAGSYSPDKIVPMLKTFKGKIVDSEKNKGSEWDFFVCVNRIGAITDIHASRNGLLNDVSDLTGLIMLYSIYITTYLTKIKNKVVKDFYDCEDIVKARFGSINLLTKEDIEDLCVFSQYNIPKNISLIMKKITSDYDIKSSNYSVGEIAKEYIDKGSVEASFRIKGDMGEFPFSNYSEDIISMEKLNKLPEDRMYVIPSAGVRFEFFDKSKNVDSIEMKESKGKIVFCVNLTNSNCLYYATGLYSDSKLESDSIELYKYAKDIFEMPIMLSTNHFKGDIDLHRITFDAKYITFSPVITNSDESLQFQKIMYTCLCCMYAAYYNPKMFSDTFKMYTINRKEKGGYSREESFRIAHLRKLPKGYKMSKEAAEMAKKFGFDYIPKGYTFVSASNVNKEPNEKKIIKVKNV